MLHVLVTLIRKYVHASKKKCSVVGMSNGMMVLTSEHHQIEHLMHSDNLIGGVLQ